MRFIGKKVLITGVGCNGIGHAIAIAFSREGAEIAIHYQHEPEIAADLIDTLHHAGTRSIALQANLKVPAAARNLIRQASEHLSGLDVLVVSSATVSRKPVISADDQEWAENFDDNLYASFTCANEAAKIMQENKTSGRIIMIGPAVRHSVSSSRSDNGFLQFTREIALEFAPHGITVNVIDPGIMETEKSSPSPLELSEKNSLLDNIPMLRSSLPEDIVEPSLFFASSGAGYITGNLIFCDGGMVLASERLIN